CRLIRLFHVLDSPWRMLRPHCFFRGLHVHDFSTHLEKLVSHATPGGGWGYSPGQAVHLEPTCLSLLALALEGDRFKAALDQGRAVLQKAANPDGAFRLTDDRAEIIWPTALVLFLQAAGVYFGGEIPKTVSRLLSWESRKPDEAQAKEVHDIDVGLVGWPWAENNFAWVEPTSWACLALRKAGYGSEPRVQEGLRLLLDRANDAGGINYGNRHVFGRLTEPIPGPTALMLLALQRSVDHPRIQAAIHYLQREIETDDDLEHLCWTKLALDAYQASAVALAPRVL